MNMTSFITAAVFLAVSVVVLLLFFIGKNRFAASKYRAYYRACCGVYVSGALLVFIFSIIMNGLPPAFVVISDMTITFVFVFTVLLIRYLTKSLLEAASKAEAQHEESERNEE